jgi:hypothetical protein
MWPEDDNYYGGYNPNIGFIPSPEPFIPFNAPPPGGQPGMPADANGRKGFAHWLYERRHGDTPWVSFNSSREPVSWQEQVESARGFTPSYASDFPETGSGLVDDRNWAWQNFFSNIGSSMLGQSAGYAAITPGARDDATRMLELQAEYDRQNAERNRMRQEDVGTGRYALDLATPPVSLAVGVGLPAGTMARGFGAIAGGLRSVAPNVFRHTGPSFVNTYFPQASGIMRGVQAAGERLPFIAGLNDVSRSESGTAFRTALPWLLGGAGYGAGTLIARSLLGRSARNILGGQTSGWGTWLAGKPANQVYGGSENLLNNRSNYEMGMDFYNAALNRLGPNILGGGGGGLAGHWGGAEALDQIEEYERLVNEGIQ